MKHNIAPVVRSSTFILLTSIAVVACQGQVQDQPVPVTRTNVPFTPDISINEIMVAQIDHAAQVIWNAGNPSLSASQIDWQEVEHHAIQLLSSRAALTMGGTGPNDAMWIAQGSWRSYVQIMNQSSLLALNASRSQDQALLTRAGDMLVETCDGCHQQYKPEIPTGGYRRGN